MLFRVMQSSIGTQNAAEFANTILINEAINLDYVADTRKSASLLLPRGMG
jgi:hypothetical protein